MKTTAILIVILLSGLILTGCSTWPRQTIHIDLPSRTEWAEQRRAPVQRTFEQAKSVLLTWTQPKNDIPPKFVQLSSSWGVVNVELKPNQTELVIKKSMFPKDPEVKNPFLFWFSPIFSNEVEIKGSSASAKEIYFVGQYQMKN